jgi:peptidyl-tRNA hydrolase, PTH1 family
MNANEVWLVIGLGNPGKRYAENRHNAGFQVAERLAGRWGAAFGRSLFDARVAAADFRDCRVVLALPQLFMNRSGYPAECVRAFHKIPVERAIAVHDDLDLAFGQVRVKVGGGHGGHNGLRDLAAHMGPDHIRVRVGISRPPPEWDPADYVLSNWTEQESSVLPEVLDSACDAVEAILTEGPTAAMNHFNVRSGRERNPTP